MGDLRFSLGTSNSEFVQSDEDAKSKNKEQKIKYFPILFILICFFLMIRRSREHFLKANGNVQQVFLYMVNKTSYADVNTTYVTVNNIDNVILY